MCCCKKILKICLLYSPCTPKLSLGIPTELPGEYVLRVDFLGATFLIKKVFEVAEELVFPLSLLNENFTFTGKVFDPNGNPVTKEVAGVEYECFSFKTQPVYDNSDKGSNENVLLGDFSDDYSEDFFI